MAMEDGKRNNGAIEALVKAAEAMPASILGMETLSPEEMSKLGDRFFALIYKRRGLPPFKCFPIVDAGNVYISALIWGLSKMALPMAARRSSAYFIMQAAAKYGVNNFPFHDDIVDSANALTIVPLSNVIVDDSAVDNTMTKHAQAFLLPSENKYPIRDEIDVKTAASYFDQYHTAMDPPVAYEYASNLKKCAMDYKLEDEVGEWVNKYAGEFRNPTFTEKVEKRADLTKEAKYKKAWESIDKIADTLDNKTLVELVWKMDKTAGIDKYYGMILPDPVQAVVSSDRPVEKNASAVAEDDMSDEDLSSVPATVFGKYYGSSLMDQFCNDRRLVYEAMSEDNKEIIKKMMQGLIT